MGHVGSAAAVPRDDAERGRRELVRAVELVGGDHAEVDALEVHLPGGGVERATLEGTGGGGKVRGDARGPVARLRLGADEPASQGDVRIERGPARRASPPATG